MINQATKAKEFAEESDRKEKIEIMLVDYVSKSESSGELLSTYLMSRIGKEIDGTNQIFDPREGHMGERVNVVEKDKHYYMILENENGNYIIEELNTDLQGDVEGGITLATPDSFEGGTMTFNPRRRK